MKNKKLCDMLVSTAANLSYIPQAPKQPTNIIRKEYPYFKRFIRALFGKPTWYEVKEWISPVFMEPKGDEIKIKFTEFK